MKTKMTAADAARAELARLESAAVDAEAAKVASAEAYRQGRTRELHDEAGHRADLAVFAAEDLRLARERLAEIFREEERAAWETELAGLADSVGSVAIDDAMTAIIRIVTDARARLVDALAALESAVHDTTAARKRAQWLAGALRRPTTYPAADLQHGMAALRDRLAPRDGFDREVSEITLSGDRPNRFAKLTFVQRIP
jgi:hypothetical protein